MTWRWSKITGFSIFLLAAVCEVPSSWADKFIIDTFEAGSASNNRGGNATTYVRAPSEAVSYVSWDSFPPPNKYLVIHYDKKNIGGPYNSGGWCGYYTLLGPGHHWFDARPYKTITFLVRGARGDENFVVGLADKTWNEKGDSVKSVAIGEYLPEGKITKKWQKAIIPLDVFLVDMREVASIAICFEGNLFTTGAAKGTVFIDDLMLE